MGKRWEIRGLFGNEYAMEGAVDDLKGQGVSCDILDRRNLSITLERRDEKKENAVKRTLEIHHGFVESEAPLGEYEAKRRAERLKKRKESEEKKRKASH